ncbi:hypothetical protein HY407_02840, partial [Candidatus Gottesmanbacteria bacterium]|nr:hypothetical protein [Candidatus Gottesmanbacteria bacterium]
MQTILLIGDDEKSRKDYLDSLIKKYDISTYNILNISPHPSIGIEDVRTIKEFLIYKPFGANSRMVILTEAEKATHEAQNALLKILEEPPDYTYIILSAKHEDLLLPTIRSRAQIIKLADQEVFADKDKNYPDILKILLDTKIGPKLLLVQAIGKTKEEILAFLDQFIPYLRGEMKSNPVNSSKYAQIIQKFLKARQLISLNTNPKLTLEVLFIGIGKSK